MQEVSILEFKVSNEFIENPLLPKSEVAKYDLEYCFEKVKEKINDYITAQSDYPNIKRPTITCNYEVRFECFVPKTVNVTEQYIISKISKEEEIMQLYTDIVLALKSLSRDEFTYFIDSLYYGKSENYVIDKIQTTRFLFGHLKNSCIVKLAKSLGVSKLLTKN